MILKLSAQDIMNTCRTTILNEETQNKIYVKITDLTFKEKKHVELKEEPLDSKEKTVGLTIPYEGRTKRIRVSEKTLKEYLDQKDEEVKEKRDYEFDNIVNILNQFSVTDNEKQEFLTKIEGKGR